MNYLDFLLLIPILIGAWKGFKKGFIVEIFTLLALFAGIYGAIHFTDYMTEILKDQFSMTSEYLPIISFTVTFLLVGAMVYFLGKLLEKAVSMVALSTLNKFAGLLFGALKMGIVSCTAVVVLESIDEKNNMISEELKTSSMLYGPMRDFSLNSIPALKESSLFKNRSVILDLFQETIDEKIGEGIQKE